MSFSLLWRRTYETSTATTRILGIVVSIPAVSPCINRTDCRRRCAAQFPQAQERACSSTRLAPHADAIGAFTAFLLSFHSANRLAIKFHWYDICKDVECYPGALPPTTSFHYASAPASPLTTSSTLSRHALFSAHASLCAVCSNSNSFSASAPLLVPNSHYCISLVRALLKPSPPPHSSASPHHHPQRLGFHRPIDTHLSSRALLVYVRTTPHTQSRPDRDRET
jgi:hypothetical protein